jgi:hypothetical protein
MTHAYARAADELDGQICFGEAVNVLMRVLTCAFFPNVPRLRCTLVCRCANKLGCSSDLKISLAPTVVSMGTSVSEIVSPDGHLLQALTVAHWPSIKPKETESHESFPTKRSEHLTILPV